MKNLPFQKLIKLLHEGGMTKNKAVSYLVQEAIATGDECPLRDYLEDFPEFLLVAEQNINMKNYHALESPFAFPTRIDAEQLLRGPLCFGYINRYNDMFGIFYDVLCLLLIIVGRVGSGKSQLVKYLLYQILKTKRLFNVLIPDIKKEYRRLLPYTNDLKVITKKHFKLNPLQLPSWMTPNEFILFFSKVFSKEMYLGGKAENSLISALEHIFKERGIFDGSQNWPTLHDLFRVISKRIENQKTFKYIEALQSIQNRLHPYILSNAFVHRIGIPITIWFTQNAVLELDDNFSDNTYNFITSYITGLIFTYNKRHSLIGSKLRTLMVVDEARTLFNANRDVRAYGESYINEVITKTREFGVGFIISSQETSSISRTLSSLSSLKVAYPFSDQNDLRFIENSFGLKREQKEHIQKLKSPGEAIVRYSGYPDPFLLAVPDIILERQVNDAEVEEKMSSFYADIFKPDMPASTVIEKEPIPANAASLLYFLGKGKGAFATTTQMKNAPGFKSPAEVSKALDWLQANSYITRQAIRTSKRGRKSVFAVLSHKALNYLGKTNYKGKGSFEHCVYQHLVSRKFTQKGWQVTIEGKIGQSKKLIDVLAQSKNQGCLALEISLTLLNLTYNITEDIRAGADSVIIVTRDAKDREKAMRLANSDPAFAQFQDKVSFCTIIDLIG